MAIYRHAPRISSAGTAHIRNFAHGNLRPSRLSTSKYPANTPAKYSATIGTANSIMFTASGVGVTIAARITIPRIA